MSSVPAWKQAILNKKREKEEEEERARREEEKRLSKLPQWKRDLLMRKQATEDRGSPPLNRAALGKSKLSRAGSLTKTHASEIKQTSGVGGRDRSGSDSAPSDEKETAKSAAPPKAAEMTAPATAERRAPTSPASAPSGSFVNTRKEQTTDNRPKVKHLLGLFGAGRAHVNSDETAQPISSSPVTERRRRLTPGASAAKPAAGGLVTVAVERATDMTDGPTDAKPNGTMGADDDEDEDECTLIDDVIEDIPSSSLFNKPKGLTSPRKEGVQSAPVSPESTPRKERRPSCLASDRTGQPRKMTRSVSFNELQIATVHHYERPPSSDESEDEVPTKQPLPSILKPMKSSPGLSSSKPTESNSGGFQSFQPKTVADESESLMPTGSWRAQASPVKTKPAKEPPLEEVEEVDSANTSALLW